MVEGGCQCGAVRYEISGPLERHALCHCQDCRASAGAPMVGWLAVEHGQMTVIKGETASYQSSELATRHFCKICGTGLFYYNETVLPGIVDVQSSTLDDPSVSKPGAHIMVAQRIDWMNELDSIPEFETFPGM